jgi:hypothetical protein
MEPDTEQEHSGVNKLMSEKNEASQVFFLFIPESIELLNLVEVVGSNKFKNVSTSSQYETRTELNLFYFF